MEGADFIKLEELILLAIAGKPEIYGLEISGDIEAASESAVQINYGSLYPYLNRLEKKGYITSRWEEENARKGARRKYYQITDTGLASLDSANLIRQRLRQPDNRIVKAGESNIQPQNNLDELLKNLEHPQEKIRSQTLKQLQLLVQERSERSWTIIKSLTAFIQTKSPAGKFSVIKSDIQKALDIIRQRDPQQDMHRIDLTSSGMIGANLEKINLRGADLRKADLKEANLRGADLREADLERANLRGADLTGAYLTGTDLRGADFEISNLQGADLRGANFAEAYLGGAFFTGADLTGANLAGANFENVSNLTTKQLHFARNKELAVGLSDDLKG